MFWLSIIKNTSATGQNLFLQNPLLTLKIFYYRKVWTSMCHLLDPVLLSPCLSTVSSNHLVTCLLKIWTSNPPRCWILQSWNLSRQQMMFWESSSALALLPKSFEEFKWGMLCSVFPTNNKTIIHINYIWLTMHGQNFSHKPWQQVICSQNLSDRFSKFSIFKYEKLLQRNSLINVSYHTRHFSPKL